MWKKKINLKFSSKCGRWANFQIFKFSWWSRWIISTRGAQTSFGTWTGTFRQGHSFRQLRRKLELRRLNGRCSWSVKFVVKNETFALFATRRTKKEAQLKLLIVQLRLHEFDRKSLRAVVPHATWSLALRAVRPLPLIRRRMPRTWKTINFSH